MLLARGAVISEVIYYVSRGTWNSAHSFTHYRTDVFYVPRTLWIFVGIPSHRLVAGVRWLGPNHTLRHCPWCDNTGQSYSMGMYCSNLELFVGDKGIEVTCTTWN